MGASCVSTPDARLIAAVARGDLQVGMRAG